MRHRLALGIALCVSTAVPVHAHADHDSSERAAQHVFADAATVAVVRPGALLGILAHLGSGWSALVRRALRLPGAVNPLDPALLTITGIDPNVGSWIAARPLRGGVHVRAALALTEARVAEALVRTTASVLKIQLSPGAVGTWQGMFPSGEPLLARLSGDVLVVDWMLPGSTASPTATDLARIIPLKSSRVWKPGKGSSRAMSPNAALAVWVDLVAGGTMSLVASERAIIAALRIVDPTQKAALQRTARAELFQCKHQLDDPATFDDVTLSIQSRDAEHAGITVAAAGKGVASKMPVLLTPVLPDGLVRDADFWFAALPNEWVATTQSQPPQTCDAWSRADWAIRRWPRMLAASDWFPLLAAVRGASLIWPHADKPLALSQIVGLIRIEPSAMSELEAWSNKRAQALSLETELRGPLPPEDRLALLSVGKKSLLQPALHARIPQSVPVSPPEQLGSLTISSKGARRLLAVVPDLAPQLDGIELLDAKLMLDGNKVRLDTELGLRPSVEKPR